MNATSECNRYGSVLIIGRKRNGVVKGWFMGLLTPLFSGILQPPKRPDEGKAEGSA
jgi:hypothetical protein